MSLSLITRSYSVSASFSLYEVLYSGATSVFVPLRVFFPSSPLTAAHSMTLLTILDCDLVGWPRCGHCYSEWPGIPSELIASAVDTHAWMSCVRLPRIKPRGVFYSYLCPASTKCQSFSVPIDAVCCLFLCNACSPGSHPWWGVTLSICVLKS